MYINATKVSEEHGDVRITFLDPIGTEIAITLPTVEVQELLQLLREKSAGGYRYQCPDVEFHLIKHLAGQLDVTLWSKTPFDTGVTTVLLVPSSDTPRLESVLRVTIRPLA